MGGQWLLIAIKAKNHAKADAVWPLTNRCYYFIGKNKLANYDRNLSSQL